MVPLKLGLRNFLAYRELSPPLDLSGIHVACLSGPNGAGKSALLDALTWALWGQARGRSDDDLVRLGETEMEVELEFSVGEQRYRVIRKRSRGTLRRAGQSLLELQLAAGNPSGPGKTLDSGPHPDPLPEGEGTVGLSPSGGEGTLPEAEGTVWLPLTANTLRETQRRIQELLGLDYYTFINSALLLQGRADEFTMKAPGDRKRVLSEVLGLARYDTLEERARSVARTKQDELNRLRGEIAAVAPEAAMRADYERELGLLREKHDMLEALARTQEGALEGLRQSQRLRSVKEAQLRESEERGKEAEGELRELALQEASLCHRIREYREVAERRQQVETAAAEHGVLAEEERRLGTALRRLMAARESLAALQRRIDDAKSNLLSQRAAAQQDLELCRATLAREAALQETAQTADARLAAIVGTAQAIVGHRTALEELGGRIRVARDRNEEIVRQGRELRAKVDQLLAIPPVGDKAPRYGDGGYTGDKLAGNGRTDAMRVVLCPLCGTELGPDGHARIVQEYEEELKRQRQAYVANDRDAKALEEQQRRRQEALNALEVSVDQERASAHALKATAEAGLQEVELAKQRGKAAEVRLAGIEETLVMGPKAYAAEDQGELGQAQSFIAALGYDEPRHRAIQARLAALEPELALRGRIDEAVRRLPEDEEELRRVQEAKRRWTGRKEEERTRTEALRGELTELPDTAAALELAQRQLQTIRDQAREASAGVGRLEGGVRRCIELEGLLHQKREAAASVEREQGIYEELALAFGRRGVQALLIETALPELEAEANRLLGRMTDNRLALKLETQRPTRSGSMSETLDITIADELGTRPYELYSGGEAFRINFALRVALSRMLARRAGAPLPTLVIDEGFGTQDGSGRERLVEAINSIADDFRCLLVITHLDEVKDAFPVRIEVSKGIDGSRARVVYA